MQNQLDRMMTILFIVLSFMIDYCYATAQVARTGGALILGGATALTTTTTQVGVWAWITATVVPMVSSIGTYVYTACVTLAAGVAVVTFSGIVIVGVWVVYEKLTKNTSTVSVQYVDEQRNTVQYQATRLNDEQKQQIIAAKQSIKIECFHVSCRSDHPGKNKNEWYAIGFILYSYNQKQCWTMNGIRCKSGYMLIISSNKVKSKKKSGVTFHNTAFKMIFAKYPNELEHTLIGGGFSIQNGQNVYNSETFNYGPKQKAKYGFAERDAIHFGTRVMNPMEQKYIAYAVSNWINKKQQNTKVSSVPEDGDIMCVHPDYIRDAQQ